ncbi:MAG: zinc-binding dehydrogenase [Synechococcales bacterium]|nr:zinc-binding dehydrogenase [Synechococcales bacterium]
MNQMRAVVVNPAAPGRLAIEAVPRPEPYPHQAIVQVHALSVNRGEVRRAQTANPGWRIGWDLAGVIEQAAADGSGFPVGTRVVGFLPAGAWGESVAVPTDAIAALPHTMSFNVAATIPVAGLTALMALEKGGLLLGKKVLITGASGGVGHTACQLAHAAGATVVAHVRRSQHVSFVKNAGAHEVVEGETPMDAARYGGFDLILDSLGGSVLPIALELLNQDGTVVTFGSTAARESQINVGNFYGKGGLNLYGFILFHEVLKSPATLGLQRLVQLVESGRLQPHIDLETSWEMVGEVAQQLQDRSFVGKAVLRVR